MPESQNSRNASSNAHGAAIGGTVGSREQGRFCHFNAYILCAAKDNCSKCGWNPYTNVRVSRVTALRRALNQTNRAADSPHGTEPDRLEAAL